MSKGGEIIGGDFIAYRSYANLLTCRAFTKVLKLHGDRIELLMRITGRSRPTCYKYTEELSQRKKGAASTGSGLPAPLHQHCESIKVLFREERAAGFAGISLSYEMARYSLDYWERLHAALPPLDAASFGKKFDLLACEVAMGNYKLGGRALDVVPLDELKELHHQLLNAKALAGELEWRVAVRIGEAEASRTGSPMPKDRRERAGAVRDAALLAPSR